ncbi:MAG: phosphate acyltransferase [Candidatus Eisenbacteria bacterium]|nr:phosphate acyltransferase [Candidatus Eisenbacteria bacterium]
MKTLNEVTVLLSSGKKKDRLRGAVFSPGEDTLLALKAAAALLPVEFRVYGGGAAVDTIESLLGDTCYEFVRTDDPVRELSQCLCGEKPGGETPFHFVVRGDLLSLEDTHRAISLAGSGENVSDLSQVAVLDATSLGRILVVSDGFVNPRPDIRTRLAIIRNGLRVCRALGMSYPRVALLAAVEQVYPGMSVTVESAEIAKLAGAGEITGADVDGPLSFDVALVEQVAREKGATGKVAGKAELLVASSIEVANGIYMAQTVLARANAASVVVGGKAPLALPFPSDCIDNIIFSICLACLLSSDDLPERSPVSTR